MSNQGENSNSFHSILSIRSESKKAFVILIVDTYFDLFKKYSFPGAIKIIESELNIKFSVEEQKSLKYRYYNKNKRGKFNGVSSSQLLEPNIEKVKQDNVIVNQKITDNDNNFQTVEDAEKYAKLRAILPLDIDKNKNDDKPLF